MNRPRSLAQRFQELRNTVGCVACAELVEAAMPGPLTQVPHGRALGIGQKITKPMLEQRLGTRLKEVELQNITDV
jgi:hypothetical protein